MPATTHHQRRLDTTSLQIWLVLCGLVAATVYLGVRRLYQVDEMQNAYMARILGAGKRQELFTSSQLFLLPLAPLARALTRSVDLMTAYRMIFVGVFWSNIVLMVKAAGLRLRSQAGAWLLLGAATLAPLWDYGYELRHDNLLLTGTVGMWLLGKPPGKACTHAYCWLGALAVILQLTAFKAFMYWMPLTAAFLVFPHPAHAARGRIELWLRWLAGAGLSFAVLRVGYGVLGLWPDVTQTIAGSVKVSAQVASSPHLPAALRLLKQTPLLAAVSLLLVSSVPHGLVKQGRGYFSWSSSLPEVLLLLGAIGVFWVNPTPYRYNLVPLAGLAFVATTRLTRLLPALAGNPVAGALAFVVFGYAHLLPFAYSTKRLVSFPNSRQQLLMDTSEAMTDPLADRVYDASGLVLSRDSIGYHWFLHSLVMKSFLNGTFPPVRQMLAEHPPSVFLPNYRTDWLAPADHAYLYTHFLPLADDFWVLGARLRAGGGTFSCGHAGRYLVVHDAPELQVAGKSVSSDIVELGVGPVSIASPTSRRVSVYWLGPRLKQLPLLAQSSHATIYNGEF